MPSKAYFKVLGLLVVTNKGLSFQEIHKISNISQLQFEILLVVFKRFFIKIKDFWKITNPIFIKYISKQFMNNKRNIKKLLHL